MLTNEGLNMIKVIGLVKFKFIFCFFVICASVGVAANHVIPIDPESLTDHEIKEKPDSCLKGLLMYKRLQSSPSPYSVFVYDWVVGRTYYEKSDYAQSLDYLYSALDNGVARDTLQQYYRLLEDVALAEFSSDKYSNSINNLSQCLDYYREQKNSEYNQKVLLQEIALNYIMIHDYDSAELFMTDALDIKVDGKDQVMFNASLFNSMGRIKSMQNMHNESILNYKKAVKLYKENKRFTHVASVYNNMGLEYLQVGDTKNALESARNALKIFNRVSYDYGIASSHSTFAQIYCYLQLWNKAKESAGKTYFIAKKNGYLGLEENYYNLMQEIYENTQDWQNALKMNKQVNQFIQDRYQKQKQEYIQNFEASYEKQKVIQKSLKLDSENRERELILKQKSMERDIFFFLVCGFIILFVFIIRRYILKIRHTDQLLVKNEQISRQNKELEELNIKYVETNTALYQSKIELENSKKENDNVFSIITHDLRSPLSSIISINEVIKYDYDELSKEELKPFISNIYGSVNNLERLLTNLLSWSRVRNGQIRANRGNKNLLDVVDDAYCEMTSEIEDKNVKFLFDVSPEVEVFIDSRIFNKVLINIFRNALKYSFPEGEVKVYISNNSLNYITLSIQDFGIGIDKKEQYKLFNNDMPVVREGTAGEKGTGLGLRVCKSFMSLNGGDIMLESDTGKGTTIMLKIPKVRKK